MVHSKWYMVWMCCLSPTHWLHDRLWHDLFCSRKWAGGMKSTKSIPTSVQNKFEHYCWQVEWSRLLSHYHSVLLSSTFEIEILLLYSKVKGHRSSIMSYRILIERTEQDRVQERKLYINQRVNVAFETINSSQVQLALTGNTVLEEHIRKKKTEL